MTAAARKRGALGAGLGEIFRRLAGPRSFPGEPRPAAPRSAPPENTSLRALTAAALALPGLAQSPALAAEADEATFQYGHYKEGERQLYGERSQYKPIEVDNLYGSGRVTLFDRWKLGFKYLQDTWSGATPIATAPLALGGNNPQISGASPLILGNGTLLYDRQFNPYRFDLQTGDYSRDKRLVHTLASASPETRKQGNFSLGYEWDEAALEVGGGVSEEPDYHSAFASLGGRWDLDQKRTSLSLGLSYTNSDVTAKLDSDTSTYYDYSAYLDQIDTVLTPNGVPTRTLTGVRQDWATHFGLTQILTKDSLVEAGFGYTRSSGFQENPYKVVDMVFVDPNQTPMDLGIPGLPSLLTPEVRAVLEQRPDLRNQWTWDARYVHYVQPLNAALHVGYRFYHDDWGINAHTFDADWRQPLGKGWTITPRVRYYSQDAADFYRPYFLFKQGEPRVAGSDRLDFGKLPVSHYSSDHRLSGYGALSGGITVSKAVGKAVTLEAGFEYYTHAGGLKLGGDGEGSFADFDYFQFNAAMRVDLSAPFLAGDGGHEGHVHGGHGGHSGGHAPAGVMFDHMLGKAGDFMAGYRYMYSLQDGNMLHGVNDAGDAAIVANGCGGERCSYVPGDMSMHMHMLDLMYAPTDWLNLMLMPQFMDMDMNLRDLAGAPPPEPGSHVHGGAPHHATGGVGDTGMYALVKLFDVPGHHVHAALGLSAPTGDVGQKIHGGSQFIHYGMQLGSGTWDFRPSLTYTGSLDRWSWGAQLNGIKRLEDRNESGFAFGDVFQSTAWGSYNIRDWLSASVRGVYTLQGSIRGQYNGPHDRTGPMDMPGSYGGRYWDVGFGLAATVPSGMLQGNRLGVEWLQPVEDDVNGYQLERKGTLFATWSLAF
jgi:hypothetical protein